MAEIETEYLLLRLIGARTALKTDNPRKALTIIRDLLKTIDPDRAIEISLRGDSE